MPFLYTQQLKNSLCIVLFFLFCGLFPQHTFAQKVDSTKDVTAKHPKGAKIVKNILYGLSFLHYTDRKKDRILDGAEDFEQYRGKKLNAIHYRSLKPYGVSIENPDVPVTKRAAKFANGIHIPTKPKVIRNEILLHVGDTIDPQLMSDMERNIWDKGIFKDQRITLETLSNDTNKVNMNIVTQDLMSWNIVDIIGIKSASVGIELKNFLGLSQHWTTIFH